MWEIIKEIKNELFTVKCWSDGSEEYELTEAGKKTPPPAFIFEGIVRERFILSPPVEITPPASRKELTKDYIEQQARARLQKFEAKYGKGHLESYDQAKLQREVQFAEALKARRRD